MIAAVKKVPKGKSLGEIEADEGGVVKESLVGMAQTKRAAQRKQARIEGVPPAPGCAVPALQIQD